MRWQWKEDAWTLEWRCVGIEKNMPARWNGNHSSTGGRGQYWKQWSWIV
jgi:hypothetical protein